MATFRLQYVSPSGEVTESPDLSTLLDTIFHDETYQLEYCHRIGELRWLRDRTWNGVLGFVRHPDRGWYVEFTPYPDGESLVLFDLGRNDASWAADFMFPDEVHLVDEQGIAWVKMTVAGQQTTIRESCFVAESVASEAILEFASCGKAKTELPWKPYNEVLPHGRG